MKAQAGDEFLDGGAAPSEPETLAVTREAFAAADLDGGAAPAPDDQPSAAPDIAAEDAGGAPADPR